MLAKCRREGAKGREGEGGRKHRLRNRGSHSGCPPHLQGLPAFSKKEKVTGSLLQT